jgi:hypothetical protein
MDDSDILDFTPVPLRGRQDGWIPDRQRGFLLALRHLRSVCAAARFVGLSRETAYRLRRRPEAASFAAAWDKALALPPAGAAERGTVLDGRLVPVLRGGREIACRRKYDNRALAALLRAVMARQGLELVR